MTSIIPDNDDAAMLVDDVDGVRVAGIIFDAGSHSKYLLKVGKQEVKIVIKMIQQFYKIYSLELVEQQIH